MAAPIFTPPPAPKNRNSRARVGRMKALQVTSISSKSRKISLFAKKPPATIRWLFFVEWLLQTSRDENRRLLSFFEEFLRDLRKLLANLAGQPVMDATGLYARDVRHYHGRRSGHCHDEPDYAEEKKAGQGDQFQHQGVPGRKMSYRSKGTKNIKAENPAPNIKPISIGRL